MFASIRKIMLFALSLGFTLATAQNQNAPKLFSAGLNLEGVFTKMSVIQQKTHRFSKNITFDYSESNPMAATGGVGATIKINPVDWFALIVSGDYEYNYAQKSKSESETEIKTRCSENYHGYYYGYSYDCHDYYETTQAPDNGKVTAFWGDIIITGAVQLTHPQFSKKIHLDLSATHLINKGDNDNFLRATNSSANFVGAGLSYTIDMEMNSMDIGLRAEKMLNNDYENRYFSYENKEIRVVLSINAWLI